MASDGMSRFGATSGARAVVDAAGAATVEGAGVVASPAGGDAGLQAASSRRQAIAASAPDVADFVIRTPGRRRSRIRGASTARAAAIAIRPAPRARRRRARRRGMADALPQPVRAAGTLRTVPRA